MADSEAKKALKTPTTHSRASPSNPTTDTNVPYLHLEDVGDDPIIALVTQID